jgi:hypothetical protein
MPDTRLLDQVHVPADTRGFGSPNCASWPTSG